MRLSEHGRTRLEGESESELIVEAIRKKPSVDRRFRSGSPVQIVGRGSGGLTVPDQGRNNSAAKAVPGRLQSRSLLGERKNFSREQHRDEIIEKDWPVAPTIDANVRGPSGLFESTVGMTVEVE